MSWVSHFRKELISVDMRDPETDRMSISSRFTEAQVLSADPISIRIIILGVFSGLIKAEDVPEDIIAYDTETETWYDPDCRLDELQPGSRLRVQIREYVRGGKRSISNAVIVVS